MNRKRTKKHNKFFSFYHIKKKGFFFSFVLTAGLFFIFRLLSADIKGNSGITLSGYM